MDVRRIRAYDGEAESRKAGIKAGTKPKAKRKNLELRKFIWDSDVDAVLGNGTVSGVRLRKVKTGERTEIACSGVFPFIGVEPNTDFLPTSIRRDDRGRVITDERMRTAEPSILAIGALRSGFSGELTGAAGEASIGAATAVADLAR